MLRKDKNRIKLLDSDKIKIRSLMELVLFQSPWICSLEFPCELWGSQINSILHIHPYGDSISLCTKWLVPRKEYLPAVVKKMWVRPIVVVPFGPMRKTKENKRKPEKNQIVFFCFHMFSFVFPVGAMRINIYDKFIELTLKDKAATSDNAEEPGTSFHTDHFSASAAFFMRSTFCSCDAFQQMWVANYL